MEESSKPREKAEALRNKTEYLPANQKVRNQAKKELKHVRKQEKNTAIFEAAMMAMTVLSALLCVTVIGAFVGIPLLLFGLGYLALTDAQEAPHFIFQ